MLVFFVEQASNLDGAAEKSTRVPSADIKEKKEMLDFSYKFPDDMHAIQHKGYASCPLFSLPSYLCMV